MECTHDDYDEETENSRGGQYTTVISHTCTNCNATREKIIELTPWTDGDEEE